MSPSRSVPGIEALSLDEKIGQLFVVDAYGVFMSESSPAYRRLLHFVRDRHVGGIIWFLSNVYETAFLNARMQDAARVPLLISADLEAGIGMRFVDTTFWAPAMAVAATGDPSLAERQGRRVAIEARALGVNHILAPVADVNVNPDNLVINARSFGEDPAEVAKYVAAFIRGVRAEGLLATAKHFPGHGDTHVDSHRSLPVLDVTRERLESVELVPFRAAIDAGVDSVMMGHLSVPSIDPTPAPVRADGLRENRYAEEANEAPENATLPATLSRVMIEGLLRRELRFEGLVVSDAFDMGGLTEHFDAGEAAVRGIEAGEDQIYFSPDTDAAIEAMKSAVASGRIAIERLDASVRRILDAKGRVPHTVGTPEEIFRTIDSKSSTDLASEIATKAITLVREKPGALPLRRSARVVHVIVLDFLELLSPGADATRELTAWLDTPPRTFTFDGRTAESEIAAALHAASSADAVVVSLAIRARSGLGRLGIPAAAKTAIERIAAANANVIGVALGTPYLLREVPWIETYLCAYGPQPVLQVAAVRALTGQAAITGRLPVTIPGLHRRGEGIQKQ